MSANEGVDSSDYVPLSIHCWLDGCASFIPALSGRFNADKSYYQHCI